MLSPPQIPPDPLAKHALGYVRPSTPKPVLHHHESQRLPDALVERARARGWQQIEVIDDALGPSASAGTQGVGCKTLLATVVVGEVGSVWSTEVSRLSRTDTDWCHVLASGQVCATWLGDAEHGDAVHRTAAQLILGRKGTLSVLESRVLQSRLFQGQEHTAQRGDLSTLVAPGSLGIDGTSLVKAPKVRVPAALALVCATLRELWSVRQVFQGCHDEGSALPVHKARHGTGQLVWPLPTSHAVKDMLQNPGYAGAYVHGQRHTTRALGADQRVRKKRVRQPYAHARVFLPEHHAPAIRWELFAPHPRMSAAHAHRLAPQDEAATSVRQGHGRLRGLRRCGRWGRKRHVRSGGKSGTAARDVCRGAWSAGGQDGRGFGGASIETQSSAQVLATIRPLTWEASLHAAQAYEAAPREPTPALRLPLQPVEDEAARAFEQDDQAAPQHRLGTSQLESRWQATWEELAQLQEQWPALQAAVTPVSEADRQMIMALGRHGRTRWCSDACAMARKQTSSRRLIRELMVRRDDNTQDWTCMRHGQGGCHPTLSMQKPLSGAIKYKTPAPAMALMRHLSGRGDDGEIARVLSKLGRPTARGKRWHQTRVASTRTP